MLRSRFFLLALLLTPALSQAATSPVKLTTQPKASVAASCVIQSLDTINFGAYSPVSGLAGTSSGQVRLICTKGTAVSASPTSGGSQMTGAGGSKLNYQLYIDSSLSKNWGAGALKTFTPVSTSSAFFTTRLTEAQFLANPDYAKGFYVRGTNSFSGIRPGYGSGTTTYYYVGYTGQTGGGGYNMPTYAASQASCGGSSVVTGQAATGYSCSKTTVSGNVATTSRTGYDNIYNYYDTLSFNIPSGSALSGGTYTVPVSGSISLTGTSTSAKDVLALPYYAQVPGGQDLAPGAYTDTVIVQVTF